MLLLSVLSGEGTHRSRGHARHPDRLPPQDPQLKREDFWCRSDYLHGCRIVKETSSAMHCPSWTGGVAGDQEKLHKRPKPRRRGGCSNRFFEPPPRRFAPPLLSRRGNTSQLPCYAAHATAKTFQVVSSGLLSKSGNAPSRTRLKPDRSRKRSNSKGKK
jgi:hypothetical protein